MPHVNQDEVLRRRAELQQQWETLPTDLTPKREVVKPPFADARAVSAAELELAWADCRLVPTPKKKEAAE